jgi:low temperature requirement protein LtrA
MTSTTVPAVRLKGLIRPVRLRSAVRLERPISWLELFFDLIFVAAVSQLAAPLAEDYSFNGLLRFAFFFTLVWLSWFDHNLFSSRFHVDDGLQRALTIAQIFVVAVMAANAKGGLTSREAAGFCAAFGVMRMILLFQYLRARSETSQQRAFDGQLIALGMSGTFWLVAAVLPWELRVVIGCITLILDTLGPWCRREHLRHVPPDPNHLPERYGLFTIILLGEFVASVMRGMEAQEAWPAFAFIVAVGGFCVAFICWWLYFEHSKLAESSFSLRMVRDPAKLLCRLYLHLPLYLSLTVAGVGFEHIIAGRHFGIEEAVLMSTACASIGFLLALVSRMFPALSLTEVEDDSRCGKT